SRTGFYPSVRAAQAFILRCEPHRLLSFGASRTGFYPSVRAAQAFILRSSFAHPSLNLRSSFGGGE
ncbi:hypothetical protein, partial [Capnocytophaga bilenii]|uniref:hypothetical protein n=1 Tax=Capnocytophaga bilenii TaxID=2819369 RepID=UPI0028D8B231